MKKLFVVITLVMTTYGKKLHDCPTDAFCRVIPPVDEPNVYIQCSHAEQGTEKSLQVCGIACTQDGVENPPVKNPNDNRCEASSTKKATKLCSRYVKSHYPFTRFLKGKASAHCVKGVSPYYCTVGVKTYLVCSVVEVNCPNPCDATSNATMSETNADLNW